MSRLAVGTVIGVVGAAIVGGLVLVGSPGEARMRRLDDRRVDDLRKLSVAVEIFRTQHRRLPASLAEVARLSPTPIDSTDPATAAIYEYRAIDSIAYELCATFARMSDEQLELRAPWPGEISWAHGAGRYCFLRRASRPPAP